MNNLIPLVKAVGTERRLPTEAILTPVNFNVKEAAEYHAAWMSSCNQVQNIRESEEMTDRAQRRFNAIMAKDVTK